jgi:hypothetical protein
MMHEEATQSEEISSGLYVQCTLVYRFGRRFLKIRKEIVSSHHAYLYCRLPVWMCSEAKAAEDISRDPVAYKSSICTVCRK